jgi:hypothetical protein
MLKIWREVSPKSATNFFYDLNHPEDMFGSDVYDILAQQIAEDYGLNKSNS